MFNVSEPHSKPCPDCGASLGHDERDDHVCDDEQRLSYQMVRLTDEIARFDDDVGKYFDSPRGRFDVWYAARQRRQPPPFGSK